MFDVVESIWVHFSFWDLFSPEKADMTSLHYRSNTNLWQCIALRNTTSQYSGFDRIRLYHQNSPYHLQWRTEGSEGGESPRVALPMGAELGKGVYKYAYRPNIGGYR